MTALTFTLKFQPAQRVDVSALVPDKLQSLTITEIAALKLSTGKAQLSVAELFALSGADTQDLVFDGNSEKLDFIGKEQKQGRITVQGNAGAYLGLGMTGGEILVSGDTGIYTGCELNKGLITVVGNAGDFLGAALPGNKMGMKGGMILVKGNAGDRVGDHMRRGAILIEGTAGAYCGSRMTAGTIAVMGQVGKHLGYAMQRGTLLLWQKPELTGNFNDCGTHTLAFLPMLFKSFTHLNSRFAAPDCGFSRVQRFAGDMAEKGRGEILIRAA